MKTLVSSFQKGSNFLFNYKWRMDAYGNLVDVPEGMTSQEVDQWMEDEYWGAMGHKRSDDVSTQEAESTSKKIRDVSEENDNL